MIDEGPSVIFLKDKCRSIFKKKFGIDAYFPGTANFFWPIHFSSKKTTDVVLFGNALHILTNLFIWPAFKNYRIWVISKKHRELLINVFGLSENQVGHIPRSYFEKQNQMTPELNFSRPLDFILSSRISHEKNIEFCLHFVSKLQRLHDTKIRLHIFSPQGNKKNLTEMIEKFEWTTKPLIKGDQGFNWHKTQKFKQPILMNLSTSFFEDFSVSTMQAQEMGWPVLLSDWGVFKEISGAGTFKISFNDIYEYYQTENYCAREEIIEKAIFLFFLETKFSSNTLMYPIKNSDFIFPRPINFSELRKLQNRWSKKKIFDMINTFADEKGGKTKSAIGKKIEHIFSTT